MAGHVADGARAERLPVAPREGMQAVMVVAKGRRAEPLVPMQAGRNGLRRRPAARAAKVAVQQRVGFRDGADGPGGDVLGHAADRLAAIALVAHLRQHLLLAGRLGQGVALGDIVGQRLLAEDVLAVVDGADGGRGMVVIGRGDQDHVEVLVALVEHLAIVVEDLGFGRVLDALVHDLGNSLLVHVHQGDEVFAERTAHAVAAHARCADHRHAQLVGRRLLGQHEGSPGDAGHGGDRGPGRGALEKATS